jgi:hypothetical protein
MTVYMVFEPPAVEDARRRAERTLFVRDRFGWSAFLVAPLWMLRHRLWLVLIGYLVVVGVIVASLRMAGAGWGARALAIALISLLVGFEAASLRRWTLLRRGWHEVTTVVGEDLEAAERRFFDSDAAHAARSAPLASPAGYRPVRPGDVIGLFPEPGAPR